MTPLDDQIDEMARRMTVARSSTSLTDAAIARLTRRRALGWLHVSAVGAACSCVVLVVMMTHGAHRSTFPVRPTVAITPAGDGLPDAGLATTTLAAPAAAARSSGAQLVFWQPPAMLPAIELAPITLEAIEQTPITVDPLVAQAPITIAAITIPAPGSSDDAQN